MFADLCSDLDSLPEVSLVAVGGLPIVYNLTLDQYELFGNSVTPERIRAVLTQGLGLGAVLTYRNPKGKALEELGHMCLGYGHQWTDHAMWLTVAFNNAPLRVRNAFAFDSRFHLSWVSNEVDTPETTFTAAASLKQWKRMCRKRDDKSFKRVQREWFGKVDDLLKPILPAVRARSVVKGVAGE